MAAWNLAGVVQQMRNHDFDLARNVVSDRRKPKAGGGEAGAQRGGFYWTGLSEELRRSLVEFVRRRTTRAAVDGRAALQAHDDAKLARREERVITLLNATVDAYAYNNELFKSWTAQGVVTAVIVAAQLKDRPEAQQLEFLRRQIEMRVLGLGWSKFATRWSSKADSRIGWTAGWARTTRAPRGLEWTRRRPRCGTTAPATGGTARRTTAAGLVTTRVPRTWDTFRRA